MNKIFNCETKDKKIDGKCVKAYFGIRFVTLEEN
jgi:hypothetical protein